MNNRGLGIRGAWVLGINRNEPVGNLTDPTLIVVEPGEVVGKDLDETESNTLDTTIQSTSNLTLGHLLVAGHTNQLTLLGDGPLLSLAGRLDGDDEASCRHFDYNELSASWS